LRRPDAKPIQVRPEAPLFCARRVWTQKAESRIFKEVEDGFQREVISIISSGTVVDHRAITAYLSIWHIRAQLALNPPEDFVLNGVSEPPLTKDAEEALESAGIGFARGDTIPGRLAAELDAMMQHDFNLKGIGDVYWGVLRGPQTSGLLCPDNPARSRWIPLTRGIVLAAGYSDQALPIEAADHLNRSAFKQAHSWVFGHPKDIQSFLRANPCPWGSDASGSESNDPDPRGEDPARCDP
jgi:hypothetical protein